MVEHPIERVRLPAPPGRDGRKFELLAQQLRAEAGKKGHDRGRLNQTASQRVCHLHISSDDSVDEAGSSPAQPSWQGFSIAEWENVQQGQGLPPAGGGGGAGGVGGFGASVRSGAPLSGSLKVITTKLRPGYLRRNGVP